MVYLMLAVAVVVIVQCVTKRKQQAESHKDAEDIDRKSTRLNSSHSL